MGVSIFVPSSVFRIAAAASRDHASTLELLDEVLIDNKVASRQQR